MRFGRLTVIEKTEERRSHRVIWLCKCDCGNEVKVMSSNLLSGHTKSCGCANVIMHRIDLTGQRFGRLIVLEPTDKWYGGTTVWRCRCDCGTLVDVASIKLRKGLTKSCGCLSPKVNKTAKRTRKEKTSSEHPGKRGAKIKDLTGRVFGELTVIGPTKERKNAGVVWECKCSCGEICYVPSTQLVNGHTTSCGHARKKDITGNRYGRLVALYPLKERGTRGVVFWACRCDCGTIKNVRENSLETGRTRSCGCIIRKKGSAGVTFAKCQLCKKSFAISLNGKETPQFCPDCAKTIQEKKTICPVCKKMVNFESAYKGITCSENCFKKWSEENEIDRVSRKNLMAKQRSAED